MSRRLKMAVITAIESLHRSGYSNRRIAETLGVHRDTVAKYVAQFQNRPNAPTGSPDAEPRASPGPESLCRPFQELIVAKLEQGLSAQRIYQDLVEDHEFPGKYPSVRRYVASLATSSGPVRRMETAAGQEAQVDFGVGAPIRQPDGKRRRTWVFRIVLSYSRKAYSEVVYRQTTEAFIGALENSFRHFGGVPKTLVIDNLKAAVRRGDWYDPKLMSFARHYGTAFLPTKPYTLEHKGKVEAGVKYVKNNALKGRQFDSLPQQNDFLLDWETRVADTRIHGTTKQQVQRRFEQERDVLLPLPVDSFPCFEEQQRTVHRDGHVEVAKAYYSTPPEYIGRRLWVRWDSRTVRIFNRRWEQVALHARAEPGQFRTAPGHIPTKRRSSVELGVRQLLARVRVLGDHAGDWGEAVVNARGVEALRVLIGLRALASRHSSAAIDEACRQALTYGVYRLKTIRALLKRPAPEQQQLEFLEEHPIIRPLSDYSLDSLYDLGKERL
ncbi:MAG: IS21 family transposase [Pirellulaceae bacterium]